MKAQDCNDEKKRHARHSAPCEVSLQLRVPCCHCNSCAFLRPNEPKSLHTDWGSRKSHGIDRPSQNAIHAEKKCARINARSVGNKSAHGRSGPNDRQPKTPAKQEPSTCSAAPCHVSTKLPCAHQQFEAKVAPSPTEPTYTLPLWKLHCSFRCAQMASATVQRRFKWSGRPHNVLNPGVAKNADPHELSTSCSSHPSLASAEGSTCRPRAHNRTPRRRCSQANLGLKSSGVPTWHRHQTNAGP